MGRVTKFTVEKIPKTSLNSNKKKIDLKDKYEDGVLDLSMCELQEVPIKEILHYPKTYSLDISSNHIMLLPITFNCLINIVKLDLSKNKLQELPTSFGDLVKLKHLDLYRNQLKHLPLSFSKLQNLKWLDLKDNPLVPKIAEVAGPCLDSKQCQSCARNIVQFYAKLGAQIEEEKMMRDKHRQQSLQANEKKKESKKKKEKPLTQKKEETEDNLKEEVKSEIYEKQDIQSKEECQVSISSHGFVRLWFFWLSGLVLFTIFVFTSLDTMHASNVRHIFTEHWHKFVQLFPEHIQSNAIWLSSYVNNFHGFIGSNLSKLLEYFK